MITSYRFGIGPRLALVLAALAGSLAVAAPLCAQETSSLTGTVLDQSSGGPVADVTVRISGTELSAVTNEDGRFVINGIPTGVMELVFDHLAYGQHRQPVELGAGPGTVEVRLSQTAIELEAIDVVGQTTDERMRRGRGSSQWVVDRSQIEGSIGTSRHLGDLIRQTIPGIRLRQSNSTTGTDVCIEFRAAATLSIVNNTACNSPLVMLDNVPVPNPNLLVGMLNLETIQEIEMLPPGEAGARYGTGSLYGVLLITTRRPGGDRDPNQVLADRALRTFDWGQEPQGHQTRRVLLSAFAGNALGLAVGLGVARRCIAIDQKDEIITTCGAGGTAASGLAAIALPALSGAVAARWAGGTDGSVGRWVPAMSSAVLMLVPGYAFALSTQGGAEADVANAVGTTLLVVGVPALVSVADRLFRRIR